MGKLLKESNLGLISRNITVMNKRTSVRLEKQMWSALHCIATRERCSIHDICTLVSLNKCKKLSLTASIRIFIMMYFKAAATEEGHKLAGHGGFVKMLNRARAVMPAQNENDSQYEDIKWKAHNEYGDKIPFYG